MNLYINMPIIINNNIDKHNISSKYYNDICYKYTSDKGTDITLNDRKNIFIDNDMNVCEENCKFEDYDLINKNAKCSCGIKTDLKLYSQIKKNPTLLLIGFKNIKNIINLKILKCYNILFNGLLKNIGFYIILFVIIFHILAVIIFYKRDYIKLKNIIRNINNITNLKKNTKLTKNNSKKNKKINSKNQIKSNGKNVVKEMGGKKSEKKLDGKNDTKKMNEKKNKKDGKNDTKKLNKKKHKLKPAAPIKKKQK